MSASYLEATFELYLVQLGKDLPKWEREYRFHPRRKWLFDFSFASYLVAVEIEGGTWKRKGRHTTAKGFAADCVKYNTATAMGWRVLRFTTDHVRKDPDGCLDLLRRTLNRAGWGNQ